MLWYSVTEVVLSLAWLCGPVKDCGGGLVLKLAFIWSCVDYFCHEAKVMIMLLFKKIKK